MASIDQQFVEYIVKSLVNKPDEVSVERTIDEKGVLLKLSVDGEDLGRVIGKRGSTAQSIRTLLRALGTKNDARYNLKIMDPEGDRRPRREREEKLEEAAATETAEEKVPEEESKPPAEKVVASEETPEPEAEELPAEETPREESKDSLAEKTRKELAELDDLDI